MTPNSNQISQDQQKNPFCSLIPKNGESSSTNLEALNQDAISRLSSIHLPHIASTHSSKFIQIVSESVNPHSKRGDRELRRSLWGNEGEGLDQQSTSNSNLTGKDDKQLQSVVDDLLPEWYSIHNPRCQTCLNPLIRGLTTRRTKGNERICSNCRTELPNPKPNETAKRVFLSVRKRRKLEAREESGNPVKVLGVEKGKRKRDEMEEIGMEQSNKKPAIKDMVPNGSDLVRSDIKISGTMSNREKIEKRADPKSSASTDPSPTALTLEERAAELKKSKLKNRKKESGSATSPNAVIDSRNDGPVSSTSSIKPQIQGSDQTPTPNDLQAQSISNSRPLDRNSTSTNSAGPSIASSSKKNLANQSSTSKSSPNPSSSRRRQGGSNPKSDLKALLAKEKSKKEAEEKEKKNQGGGGLRGFLDSL